MKVAVIGAGSTYTPELVRGLIKRFEQFPLTELWLMDIDPARLEIVGEFARRMVDFHGQKFRVIMTGDLREAVGSASYVITQLRVGQMEARRQDEYLGMRHGLVGQETTGVGGMAMALRTVPIILKIAADMVDLAPSALLLNFTNPSGLVTQALSKYAPKIQSVGVCNSPITTKMAIIKKLEEVTGTQIDPNRCEIDSLGLNHLSWYRGFQLDGMDLWPAIIERYILELKKETHPEWDPSMVEELRMIPNSYLQYYYHPGKMIALQEAWPPSRAEEVMEVEKELLQAYADRELREPPEKLMLRGGAYYSTVATQLLVSHYNDLGERHIVNTSNKGAVKDWPNDWVLELPAKICRNGIVSIPSGPLPPTCTSLLKKVKAYEVLTVEAAVTGDRHLAFQALQTHPLGPHPDKVTELLNDMLTIHRAYLPQFWDR